MGQLTLNLEKPVWSVSGLTAEIHRLLSRSFDDIRVAGEISGYKVWQSGHAYFTLKDSGAQIRCVLFRNALRYMKFRPQDGLAVVARGSVEVRQERGEYQFIVSGLEPQGYGELQLAFEQLKQRLAAEGLFDAGRKRNLPRFPQRIGIVTSPRGAVIRDMINVLTRRWPGLEIRLYPTLVQGEGAIEGVCAGIEHFSHSGWADVVIVGRGGGSLEDLWTFNTEPVARAIASSSVPIVSAVGHETDFTIADFVADLRAPTPSAAAELVAPSRTEYLDRVQSAAHRAGRAVRFVLSHATRILAERGVDRAATLLHRRIGRGMQRTDETEYALRAAMARHLERQMARWRGLDQRLRERDLRLNLTRAKDRLGAAEHSAADAIRLRLEALRRRYLPAAAELDALSPLNVLERGYSIVESESGEILRDSARTSPGDLLKIRMHKGRVEARVEPETPTPDDSSALPS